MHFTRFSKSHLLFEIRFYRQAPGSFSCSKLSPWFTQKTLKRKRGMQLGPWAMEAAALAKIRRLRRGGRLGKGRRTRGSPAIGLWWKLGLGWLRWWPTAATAGGGCWSCCSGEESGAAGTQVARVPRVGSRDDAWEVGWRWTSVRLGPAVSAALAGQRALRHARARGTAVASIARASRCGSKPSRRRWYPGLQCHGTATGVVLRERKWPAMDCGTTRVASTARYGAGMVQHASLGGRREGDQRLWPRGGGHRAPTDAEAGAALCARLRPSRQGAWRAGGTLERGWAVFQPVNPLLTTILSKKLNCATKTIDTKVVDETSLYNICKGCPMIFSMVCAGTPSKVRVLQSADE
jgi:hypothetical protein